jgi:tetratricopeptide (TPR) repeat protein
MSRWCIALVFAGIILAQQQAQKEQPRKQEIQKQAAPDVQLPPEEDAGVPKPEEYVFNPVKSKRDVAVGSFYLKKGDYKAAAGRFREATKWNDGNAEAWLLLGQAEERNDDAKAARAAYERYLQLAPDAKHAQDVRKRLEKLKGA